MKKSFRKKMSLGFRKNVSIHPFVIIAITAALTVVVLLITLYYFKFIR